MTTWKGKSRGGALGYKIFVFILRYLGIRAAYLVLIFVAFYFLLFSPKSTKISYHFFRKRLKWGVLGSVWGVYRTYYSFGQVILDKTAAAAGLSDRYTSSSEGVENIQKVFEDGGVLISGHIGNWDMAGYFLKNYAKNKQENKIHIVMMDAEHQQIKEVLEKTQRAEKVNIIAIKPDFSHVIEMGKAIQNKEVLCMHGDRFMEGAKTLEVDFMGEKAHLPLGPFRMAIRLKVPCSLVFAMKAGGLHYKLSATTTTIQTGKPQALAQAFANQLAAKIKEYPYQWFNFYDFWATPKIESNKTQV